jgi:3-methyl-2-oxobutanoate hydroxymethyltransferase
MIDRGTKMKTRLTVQELRACKGRRQLTQVYVTDPDQAAACEAAGIDMLVAGSSRADLDRARIQAIRDAAPNTFLTVPISLFAAVSDAEAIRLGLENLRIGADAVYTSISIERVRAMAREHIPVIGHVGLVPLRSTWYGGFRAVGKSAEEAVRVLHDTLAYQEAGAIAVEMELVPHRVATEISGRADLLVISMGSGRGGDVQYLFACDILGTQRGHIPRHAKVYRRLADEYNRLQQETIEAFKEFKADVDTGAFPEGGHCVEIEQEQFDAFLGRVGQ